MVMKTHSSSFLSLTPEQLAYIGGELKNPRRNVALVVRISLLCFALSCSPAQHC